MNYLSIYFAIFVLLFFCAFYIVAIFYFKKIKTSYLLLAGSLIFYCSFDIRYTIFLLFTTLSTYLGALILQKKQNKKVIYIFCIVANIVVWFAVKLLPWTVKMGSYLLHFLKINVQVRNWTFIVPVGISYFTLQAIGYLTDVYRGKIQPEKTWWKYLLFLSYFPAVIQGPISRYDELMPQLLDEKKPSFETTRKGLLIILVGVVKKIVVADRIGIFVDSCFQNFENFSGIILYLAIVGYAVQLYLDFSGCVDICRGVSSLFCIDLVNNFDRPYLATSVKQFWGKWHISLSRWLKDYVYIPLGGNRKGIFRKYLNILIVFLISGFWHGAGFSFLFWGCMHAIYQIVGDSTFIIRKKLKCLLGIEKGSFSERFYQTVITFHLVTFAWIFFRSESLLKGIRYITRMISNIGLFALFNGSLFETGVSREYFLIVAIHIFIILIIEICEKRQGEIIDNILTLHVGLRWLVYWILIFDVLLFGVYGNGYDASRFIYGDF